MQEFIRNNFIVRTFDRKKWEICDSFGNVLKECDTLDECLETIDTGTVTKGD